MKSPHRTDVTHKEIWQETLNKTRMRSSPNDAKLGGLTEAWNQRQTISKSYSRQTVNSRCETIINCVLKLRKMSSFVLINPGLVLSNACDTEPAESISH